MKRKIKIGAAVLLIAVIGITGTFTYRHFKGKENIPMMGRDNGITETVTRSSLSNTITASGSVLLDDEIEVYAEGETNIIKTILVEEGDTVQEGDLLVEYDVDDRQEELEKQIRDTKREIENAQLSLTGMTTPASDTEIAKLQNTVTAKEKALQEAETNYSNYATKLSQQQTAIDNAEQDVKDAEKEVSDLSQLLAVGGATQSEYDAAVTAAKKANDTLTEAKQNYDDLLTEQNNAKLSITTAQNDVADAKNDLKDSQTVLGDTDSKTKYEQQKLTLQGLQDNLSDYEKDLSELVYSTSSTVNGKVTEVCVDEGTYTEENTVILKVADFNKLIVSASIEEYDAPLLELGQKVVMTSDGLEGKEYTGTITRINDSAEAASTNMGTETAVPIEISVDNPDGVLKPGYNLDLEITILDKENILTISESSIQTDAKTNTKYVFAVEGGIVKKKEITTGEESDTVVEVLTGLNEGDEVIKSVSDDIKEGMTLEEVKALNAEKQSGSNSGDNSENGNDMRNGGMGNDQNRGTNQGVPSGGPGGGGFGGGRPMG
ncbi:MAG: efflux RND transporter periplasmic adaptor subunit [Clostridia bacterium]|nr:efflux RND transporter periplasmic adaptor subunit [Clostridia bacterium]